MVVGVVEESSAGIRRLHQVLTLSNEGPRGRAGPCTFARVRPGVDPFVVLGISTFVSRRREGKPTHAEPDADIL